MKKQISLWLACVLCLMLTMPCFAASANIVPTITKNESTLTVALPLAKDSGVATFLTTLHYDQAVLTLQNVTFQGADMTAYKDDVAGEVKLSAVWAEAQSKKGDFCIVTFGIQEGAKNKLTFTFTDTEATDQNDAPMQIHFGKNDRFSYNLANGKTDANKGTPAPNGSNADADSTQTDKGNANIPETNGAPLATIVTILAVTTLGLAVIFCVLQTRRSKKA